jgi:hypothetical protein
MLAEDYSKSIPKAGVMAMSYVNNLQLIRP